MNKEKKKEKNDVLACIGHTPMVMLNRFPVPAGAAIHTKLEFANPGGSLKDRTALGLVEDAERKGLIRPDTVLIEATSGNMGVGLALIAARKGLRLQLVMSEKNRGVKSDLAHAMGAEIVFAGEDVPWESEDGALGVAERLARTTPGGLYLNQFANPANVEYHYRVTASEIIDELDGDIDVVVAGIGTGGTVSGVGRRLREINPNVRVYGVAGVGSVFDTQHEKEGYIEGIGSDFVPKTYDASVVDRVMIIDPDTATKTALALLRTEGIMAGHSSGAVVAASLEAARLHPGSRIVAVLADTMRNYQFWRLAD